MKLKQLVKDLYELGAVKFGSFTLKSGVVSPFYIDLRLTISKPKLLVSIAELMYEKIKDRRPDLVCGVPYTALPFATAISIAHSIPMLLCRKEQKEYGTKKRIEGVYQAEQNCLVVEDVITSGASIFETVVPLEKEGVRVTDIVILVDREQGGKAFIEKKGIRVHVVCPISLIMEELLKERHINEEMVESVQQFIKGHQTHANL